MNSGSAMMRIDSAGNFINAKSNPRFNNYKHMFENLLKMQKVETHFPIVSMMLTNDKYTESKVITLTKKSEK